jgi:hypothetical protein
VLSSPAHRDCCSLWTRSEPSTLPCLFRVCTTVHGVAVAALAPGSRAAPWWRGRAKRTEPPGLPAHPTVGGGRRAAAAALLPPPHFPSSQSSRCRAAGGQAPEKPFGARSIETPASRVRAGRVRLESSAYAKPAVGPPGPRAPRERITDGPNT